jgi:hypothetical protein
VPVAVPVPVALAATDDAVAALTAGRDSALFSLSNPHALDLLARYEELQRVLDYERLRLVRHLDVNEVDGRLPAREIVIDRTLCHPDRASQRVQLAKALDGALAATGRALGDGRISERHAWVTHVIMGMLRRSLPADERAHCETQMLTWAETLDPKALRTAGLSMVATVNRNTDDDDLARTQRANRYLSLHECDDGMLALHGRLDPDSAAVFSTALDALSKPDAAVDGVPDVRSLGQRRLDALVELADRSLTGGGLPTVGGIPPQVNLLLTAEELLAARTRLHQDGPVDGDCSCHQDGRGDGGDPASRARLFTRRRWLHETSTGWNNPPPAYSITGQVVPRTIYDRILCDANIRRIIMDVRAAVVDVGRTSRTITPAMRAALFARDGGCSFPNCDRPVAHTLGHHIVPWTDGGPTDLSNLTLVCFRHHQYVHRDGWQVRIGPSGHAEWKPPTRWGDRLWKSNPVHTARTQYATPTTGPP